MGKRAQIDVWRSKLITLINMLWLFVLFTEFHQLNGKPNKYKKKETKKESTPKASKLSMWHLKENFDTKSNRKEIR